MVGALNHISLNAGRACAVCTIAVRPCSVPTAITSVGSKVPLLSISVKSKTNIQIGLDAFDSTVRESVNVSNDDDSKGWLVFLFFLLFIFYQTMKTIFTDKKLMITLLNSIQLFLERINGRLVSQRLTGMLNFTSWY